MSFRLEIKLMDLSTKCVEKMTKCIHKQQFKKYKCYVCLYNTITNFKNKLYHYNWDFYKLGDLKYEKAF